MNTGFPLEVCTRNGMAGVSRIPREIRGNGEIRANGERRCGNRADGHNSCDDASEILPIIKNPCVSVRMLGKCPVSVLSGCYIYVSP